MLDALLILLDRLEHILLELAEEVVEFTAERDLEILRVLILHENLLEHVVRLLDMRLLVDSVVALLGLLLLVVFLLLDFCNGLVILQLSLAALVLRDQLIIEVFKAPEHTNGEEFVVAIRSAGVHIRVVLHVEYLQVVAQLLEVTHGVIVAAHVVLAEGEYIELREGVETFDVGNLIRIQRKIGQLGQRLEALDLGDHVEREIEPREVLELAQVLNLANDVVVELQLGQFRHTIQVIDADDVLVAERKVLEVPQRVLIPIKYLVVLIVLNEVLLH